MVETGTEGDSREDLPQARDLRPLISPEQAHVNQFITLLEEEKIEEAIRLSSMAGFPKDVLDTDAVRTKIELTLAGCFYDMGGYLKSRSVAEEHAHKLISAFDKDSHLLNSESVQSALLKTIGHRILAATPSSDPNESYEKSIKDTADILGRFQLYPPPAENPKFQSMLSSLMLRAGHRHWAYEVTTILKLFPLGETAKADANYREHIPNRLLEALQDISDNRGRKKFVDELREDYRVAGDPRSNSFIRDLLNKQDKIAADRRARNLGRIKEAIELLEIDPEIVQEQAGLAMPSLLASGDVRDAITISEEFLGEAQFAAGDLMKAAVVCGIGQALVQTRVSEASLLKKHFPVPEFTGENADIHLALEACLLQLFTENRAEDILQVTNDFPPQEEFIASESIQSAVSGLTAFLLTQKKDERATELDGRFKRASAATNSVVATTVEGILKSELINSGDFERAKRIITYFNPPQATVERLQIAALRKYWGQEYSAGDERAESLIKTFSIPPHVCQKAGALTLSDAICKYADRVLPSHIAGLEKLPHLGERFEPSHFPKGFETLIVNLELYTPKDFFEFIGKHEELIQLIAKDMNVPTLLTASDVEVAGKLRISLCEAEELRRAGVSVQKLLDSKDYEGLFTALCKHSERWKDVEEVQEPFAQGAAIFSHKQMFRFVNQSGALGFAHRNRLHDALYNFHAIIELYEVAHAHGVSETEFYNNILQQVQMDTSFQSHGTSYNLLNTIANGINRDFNQVKAVAEQYPDLQGVNELAQILSNPQTIFTSWENLKKYFELARVVERKDLLEALQAEKKRNPRSYAWHEKVGFHRDSHVSIAKVMSLLTEPATFLAGPDYHTDPKIHERKKPSNYLHIPHLDLTAIELRDALTNGILDRVQLIAPLEIEYRLPSNGYLPREALRVALGTSKSEEIPGAAKNPGKVYHEAKKILAGKNLTVQAYLADTGNKQILPVEIERELLSVIYHAHYGMPCEMIRVKAKMNAKSDPDGVLAGNDTACCMEFGTGKATEYMFRLVTSLFTLQIETANKERLRTFAQSLMAMDMDIGIPVPTALQQLQANGMRLEEVLPREALARDNFFLAADNVEVTPGYQDPSFQRIIELIYGDFYREYMLRHGKPQKLETKFMPIGMNQSDALTHLPKIDNTFAPLTPYGYSDMLGGKVLKLTLPTQPLPFERSITEPPLPTTPVLEKIKSGLNPLTVFDTIPVSYLEGKAYHDNRTLIEGLHKMENTLTAVAINNEAKGRPNLSLGHFKDGMIDGYLIAYEGKFHSETDESGEGPGEPVVYIADLASTAGPQGIGGAGRELLRGLMQLYIQNYANKNNPIPILADLREKSSYLLLASRVKRLSELTGIEFEMQELRKYAVEGENFRTVIIRPKLSSA